MRLPPALPETQRAIRAWNPSDEGALTFLGFGGPPAPCAPGPTPIFAAESRLHLAESVLAEVLDGCAVLAVRGESGVGKTCLVHLLAAELQAHRLPLVRFAGPPGQSRDVQRLIGAASGLAETDREPAELLHALRADRGVERLVVLVDQAEKLSTASFRALWRLTRLRDTAGATLQLILVGALGPWPGLRAPDLERLRKATLSCYVLFPFCAGEAASYLDFSLGRAQASRRSVMSRRAAQALLERAKGNPARIDDLARQALAYAACPAGGRLRLTVAPHGAAPRLLLPPPPLAPGRARRSSRPAFSAVLSMLVLAALSASSGTSGPAAVPRALPKPAKAARHAALAAPAPAAPARGGPGLLLIAGPDDTIATLYARLYRGVSPPPYRAFVEANPASLRQSSLVVVPEPRNGWVQR